MQAHHAAVLGTPASDSTAHRARAALNETVQARIATARARERRRVVAAAPAPGRLSLADGGRQTPRGLDRQSAATARKTGSAGRLNSAAHLAQAERRLAEQEFGRTATRRVRGLLSSTVGADGTPRMRRRPLPPPPETRVVGAARPRAACPGSAAPPGAR